MCIGNTENLAHQDTQDRVERNHNITLPGRYGRAVATPGMLRQFSLVEDVVIDPYLQVNAITVELSFQRQALRCGLQEFRFLTMRRRVSPPQVTQNLSR